ncbi:MAG: putative two-component system response regulator [Flavobacteriales bacterium]|jgi:putative two-component system response regulator
MTRVLLVDDQADLATLLRLTLESRGLECTVVQTAAAARIALTEKPFELLLCDLRLPDGTGLELVEQARANTPDMAVVMLSAVDDMAMAQRAVELGASAYLVKPVQTTSLLISVNTALRRRDLERQVRQQHSELENLVERRSAALMETVSSAQKTLLREQRAFDEIVAVVARATSAGGDNSALRAGHMARIVSGSLGLPPHRVAQLANAVAMRNLGMSVVAREKLASAVPLDATTRAAMQTHTTRGYELFNTGVSEVMELAAEIAQNHHERLDGSGYPAGLSGDQLSLESRIAAAIDVFDALTCDRPYRRALSAANALAFIEAETPTQYDTRVVAAIRANIDRLERLCSGEFDAV